MTETSRTRVGETAATGAATSSVGDPVRGSLDLLRACAEPGCHAAVFSEGHAACAEHRLSASLRDVEDSVHRHMSPSHPSSIAAISRAIQSAKTAGASAQEIQRVSALGRRRANRDAEARIDAALVAEQTAHWPEGWLR